MNAPLAPQFPAFQYWMLTNGKTAESGGTKLGLGHVHVDPGKLLNFLYTLSITRSSQKDNPVRGEEDMSISRHQKAIVSTVRKEVGMETLL